MVELRARGYEVRGYDEGQELYQRRGWTDGHPIVVPTEERAEAWFGQLGLDPAVVVGSSIQRNRTITVEHVVINSIMAGCVPEAVPLVIACLRSMLAERFFHNHIASLGGPWPFFLVNGPVVTDLGLNADQYVMGPGHRSNSTVARAVSLTMWNALEARIGGIQRGAFGPAWRNESLVPERQDSIWPQLHEDLGYAADQSTVTSFPATDFEQVLVHLLDSPEHVLAPIVDSISNGRFVWGTYVIILPPNMVAVFDRDGWTKDDIRAHVFASAKRSVAGLKRRTRWAEQQAGRRPWPDLLDVQPGEEDEEITLFVRQPEYDDIAFRDKFLESRDSGLFVMNSGGDSGPCAYVLIPYTESGPSPQTVLVE